MGGKVLRNERGLADGERGQEAWGGHGLGIKLIGVSAKSVTGFGDSKGRHVLSSLLILI